MNNEAPQEPVFTPVFQKALKRGIKLAETAVAAIKDFDGTSESLSKLLRDANSLAQFHCSDTQTIAIVGASGEGKHKPNN